MHVVFALLRAHVHCEQGENCSQGSHASPASFPRTPVTDGPVRNLYIDAKRILNACGHPAIWGLHKGEDELQDELCLEINLLLDRLVHCVRPQQLLFVAVGGAPQPQGEGGEQQAPQEGGPLATPPGGAGEFPELAFMRRLTTHLSAFMPRKLGADPTWGAISRVILSGSSVPGTGEQKIARFMERQHQPSLFCRHLPKRLSLANHGSSLVYLGLLPLQLPRCFKPQGDAHMAKESQQGYIRDEMVIVGSPKEGDIGNLGVDTNCSLARRIELSICSVQPPSPSLVPGGLQWSPSLHSFFPAPFQRAVQELLLINERRGFAVVSGGQRSELEQQQQQQQQAQRAGLSIRLPEEVFMLVLAQLARPLGAWVPRPSARPSGRGR